MPRETVVDGCRVCMVGEAMEQFAIEGIDHMGWNAGSGQFVKTSHQDPPLMEVQVKVLTHYKQQKLLLCKLKNDRGGERRDCVGADEVPQVRQSRSTIDRGQRRAPIMASSQWQVLKQTGHAWHGHYRGAVGDLLGRLGQVQEDDWLEIF